MQQTKVASLVEAIVGTIIGFISGVVTQVIVFPLYGINIPLHDNFSLVVVFTVVSAVRSYGVRRLFNASPWLKFKGIKNAQN